MKSRRQIKEDRQHRAVGVVLLFCIILVVGGIIWAYKTFGGADLDKVTMCPGKGPIAHTVLLVDKTDPLNFTQKVAFDQFLKGFATNDIKEGELLSVFVLGEDFKETSTPIYEMCNPGDGEGASEWIANPKRLRARFEEQYLDPLMSLSDQLVSFEAGRYSPIMEMLQFVAINGFRKNDVKGPRRLVMVSDMLQNTPGFSHYKGDFEFEEFAKTTYFQKIRSNLRGVEVRAIYLLHTPDLQTRRNEKFWEDFMDEMNAKLVFVDILEG